MTDTTSPRLKELRAARVRMPDDAPLIESSAAGPPQPPAAAMGEAAASTTAPQPDAAALYQPMETAQMSRRLILWDGAAQECEAYFRITRAYDRALGRWVRTAFWAQWSNMGVRVPFEPAGWRAAP
jgi:hypothetical protein